MATDDPIRASDSDREVVVAALRDAYTAGRITMEEFDERTSAAYTARTWGDLRKLTVDLPVQPILGGDIPGRRLPSAGLPTGQLPSHPPRANLPPARPHRRRHPAAILIPIAVWVLIAMRSTAPGGDGDGTVVLVLTILLVVGLLAAIRRR
jgi:MYXO-CTERM domain-containing protein